MLTTLYRIIAVISAVALVSLTLLTTADVVARYAVSAPIHAAMEGISYLLALLILAGYGLVTRDRTHIAVGILPEIFPRIAKVERHVTALFTLGGTVLVTWLLWKQASSHLARGQMGETVPVPLGWIILGLTILSAAAILFALRTVFRPEPASDTDH